MEMMNAYLKRTPAGPQSVFAHAFTIWTQVYERYCLLQSISDCMACSLSQHPVHNARLSALDAEIEDLECALEEVTETLSKAPDIMPTDLEPILEILMVDFKIRHQISNTDLTVVLVTTAQRILQYSENATNSSDRIEQ
ncbi:MAG: hypothetical protein HQ501_01825 [Rhodospirillales bacterium]|nr:hypothetical protein [Rhodospirillales bacterium]